MFDMMNEARLEGGHQALTHASTAYLYSLDYAKTRIQGRFIENMMNHEVPSIAIFEHPDVRDLEWL